MATDAHTSAKSVEDELTKDEYAALSTALTALEDYVKELAKRIKKLEEEACNPAS